MPTGTCGIRFSVPTLWYKVHFLGIDMYLTLGRVIVKAGQVSQATCMSRRTAWTCLHGWCVNPRALPRLCYGKLFWFLEDLTFLFAICLHLGIYFPSLRNNTKKKQLPVLGLGVAPSCYELDIMLKHKYALHSDMAELPRK